MDCPICGKNAVKNFSCMDHEFRETPINLFECDCGAIFVDKKTIGRNIADYYHNSYYERPGPLSHFLAWLRSRNFNNLNRGAMLDVGCGSGFFIEKMSQKNWKATGQEVSSDSKNYLDQLSKKNIKVFYGEIEKINFDGQFDLVTLFHVLEHVEKPLPMLKKIRQILKKDGTLFIATPNAKSFSSKLFGANWFHLDPPRHLILYSKDSLEGLLKKAGFSVKKVSRFSFEYDPFGLAQSFYNSTGMEFNFLYKLLKKKKINSKGLLKIFYTTFTIVTFPFIFFASILFSLFLGLFLKQDTIEIIAN